MGADAATAGAGAATAAGATTAGAVTGVAVWASSLATHVVGFWMVTGTRVGTGAGGGVAAAA